MATYECDLSAYGTEALSQVADVQLMGTAKEKAAILAFVMDERIRMTSAPSSTRKGSPSGPSTTTAACG